MTESLIDFIAQAFCNANERTFGEPSESGDWIPNAVALFYARKIAKDITAMGDVQKSPSSGIHRYFDEATQAAYEVWTERAPERKISKENATHTEDNGL